MKRYKSLFFKFFNFCIAATLLVSCGVYNKYERPDVNTTGLIRDVISDVDTLVVQDTASFGNLPWRSVFTDPQLRVLIEQGLEKNTNLLNAALTVEMYETMLKAAKLAFLPAIQFGQQANMASISTLYTDPSATTRAYTLPVSASWTLDLFGNILSQKRSTQMKLQYNLGRVRSTGVQSAEASYLSMLTQANEFKRQIRATENALSLLIGQAGQQIPRSTLAEQYLPSEFSTGCGVALLMNRPDVHNAEMNLAACFHDVQTARAQFYPNITIGASAAFTNSNGNVNPGKWLLSLFGSLTQPIFQRGALTANLKVSKFKYEQAFNTWQNAILSAGNEVSNALVNYNSFDANSKLEAQRIEILKKNVEDTKALYKSSGSSYLEVLTAETQLLSAQLNKASDDFSKMQSVVSLYTALGGGGK